MKKMILRVTLDIEVSELSDENLKLSQVTRDEVDPIEDSDPEELAEIAANLFGYEESVAEAFAGSAIYLTFDRAEVVSAEYCAGPPADVAEESNNGRG